MSFLAYVPCDCYETGKANPPAHPELVKADETGVFLEMQPPLWGSEKGYQIHREFFEWKKNACEHPNMRFLNIEVCTSGKMEQLRSILDSPSLQYNYPTLFKHLPKYNDGKIPASDIQDVAEELIALQDHLYNCKATRVELYEIESGRVIAAVNSNTYSLFAFTGGNTHSFGLDIDGFFICENLKRDEEEWIRKEVFRTKYFFQEELENGVVLFTDILTGYSYQSLMKIEPELQGWDNNKRSIIYSVRCNSITVYEQFRELFLKLELLLDAAIKVNKAIVWQ